MKKHFSHLRGLWRRSVSLVLVALLAVSTMSVASAATKSDSDKSVSSAVQEMIKKGSKTYPKGAFGLLNTTINMTEGDEDQKITVVRMGSTEGEATVEFHALDVSTKYGEDYELYMNDGFFGSERKLETSADNKSLMDTYGGDLEAYDPNEAADEKSDEKTIDKTAKVSEESKDGLTELQKAQVAQTGTLNKTKTWREIADENSEEYKDADKMMKNGAKNIQAMINSLGGVTEKLTFADGETTKEIIVRVPDDETSDGETQAMFALTNASTEVSDASDGYINIKDDEKAEEAKYEFKNKDIKVRGDKESVKVTLKKSAGTESLSVVTLLTTDGTAKENENYEATKETLIFAKGITEKTVEIPLKGNASGENLTFYVGAGNEKGEMDEDNGLAKVTILPNKSKASTGADTAKASTGADTQNKYSSNMLEITFDKWDCHCSYNKCHGSSIDYSDNTYDLRNATRVHYYNLTDWGNGKQHWTIGVQLSDGTNINVRDSTWNYKSRRFNPPIKVRKNENDIYGEETWLPFYYFTDEERQKLAKYGKEARFYVWIKDEKGWGAEDWGNNNLTYMRVEYAPITIKTNFANTELNYYRPVTYNSTKDKKSATTGIFLIRPHINGNYDATGTIQMQYNSFRDPSTNKVVTAGQQFVLGGNSYYDNANEAGVKPSAGTVEFEGFYAQVEDGRYLVTNHPYTQVSVNEFAEALAHTKNREITIYPKAKPRKTTVEFVKTDNDVAFNTWSFGDKISCTCLDAIRITAHPLNNKTASVNGFKATCGGKEIPIIYDEGVRDAGYIQLNGDCADKTVKVTPLKGTTSLTVMANPKGRSLDMGAVTYSPDPDNINKTVSGDYKNALVVPDPVVDGTYTIVGVGKEAKVTIEVDGKKKQVDTNYITEWWDGSADTNGDGVFSRAELDNYYGKNAPEPTVFRGTAYEYDIKRSGAHKIYYQFALPNGVNPDPDKVDSSTVFGNTYLKEKTIFPISKKKSRETALNGVSISGGGGTAVSGAEPDNPKNEGWFEIWSQFLDPAQRSLLVSNYIMGDGTTLNMSNVALPNSHKILTFDVDGVMDVTGGKLEYWDDGISYQDGVAKFTEAKWKTIESMTGLKNDDCKYKLTVNTVSKLTSRQPSKVHLYFFNPDGTAIEKENKSGETGADNRLCVTKELKTSDYGTAELEFNPHELKLYKGCYLGIQIEDQFGVRFPVMNTGYQVYEAIGEANLSSTFAFGGAFAAVKIIGLVQGKNGTHWNGEMDPKKSSNVVEDIVELSDKENDQITAEKDLLKATSSKDDKEAQEAIKRLEDQLENNEMKTITLTLGIGKDDIIEKDKTTGDTFKQRLEQKADADVELQKAKKALDDAKPADKAKAQEAYDKAKTDSDNANANYSKAVEEKLKPTKTKTEFARSVKMGLAFTFAVSFKYDEAVTNWYFDTMIMTITAEGELDLKWKFATPVGVTINLGINVQGEFSASVIFRDKIDSKKFYLSSNDKKSNLQPDSDGSLNILALAADQEYIDTSGMFNIKPAITPSASVEVGPLEAKVSGTVGFDMKFYTDPDIKNTGTVSLSAEVSVTVFGIGGSWEFTTDPINLFGADAESLDDELGLDGDATKMFGSADRLTAEDTSYADNRKGWQGMNPVSAKSLDENDNGVLEQKLQEKIYTQSKVDIVKINENGDYLGVFVDVDKTREGDINKPAVFYSVYDGEKGTWSKPEVVENDGTGDQDVRVADLGSRGLFVYWNSYSEAVKDDISKTELMNKLELRGAFFNKSDKTFNKKDDKIDVIDITKDTDEVYGDIDASVVVNKDTMLVYYTKNYYAVSNEKDGELIGDVARAENSYQVFRTYNFSGETGTDGAFVDDFDNLLDTTVAQEIKEAVEDYDAYVKSYYGQVFLNTAPDVYVEETMDDTGRFWAEQPKIYAGHSVKTVKTGDGEGSIVGETTTLKGETVKAKTVPVIVDYDSISYNDLGIFAYSVDYDNDLTTVDDRDVYFQLYDFETGIMTHPVVVTSDNVQDADVHLSRQSYTDKDGKAHAATLLSWIADGEIVSLDISNVIKNLGEAKTTEDGTKYYLIEKTEEAGYVPPMGIASHKPEDENAFEDDSEMTAEEQAQVAPEITSFDIYCTEGYNYYVWTDRTSQLKEGVKPDSEEASDAKNRVSETQIYMVRNDLVNGVLTGSVQVTSEQGANYEDVRFVVNNDGTLKALAKKSGSHVVTVKEYNEKIEENNKLLPEDEQAEKVDEENFNEYNTTSDEKDLVALDINPVSVAKLRNTNKLLENTKAGEPTFFDITVLNDGIDTLDEVTVTAVDNDGNGVISSEDTTVKSKKLENIIGGETEKIAAMLNPDANADSASITLTLTDKDGKVIDEKTVSKDFAPNLEFTDLEVEKTNERDIFDLSFDARNFGTKASAEKALEIGVVDKDGKDVKLTETTLEALYVDEQTALNVESLEADSAKYFVETKDEDGNLTETGTFYVTDGEARAEGTVERTATAAQVKAVESLKTLTFNGGDTISAANGEKTYANILLDGKPLSETEGVRMILESSDQDIFTINGENSIETYKNGEAKLIATILPANSAVTAEYDGTEGDAVKLAHEVDNYADVPTSLIRAFEGKVKVTDAVVEPTDPTDPTNPTDPEPTQPEKVTKVVKNGVTYKVSGKSAVVSKYDNKSTSVTIPATVKIDGKSYKVTKINANTFKNSKLTSVKIGKNVTAIAKKAFMGSKKLTTVTGGTNVKTIAASAFENCAKLKKFSLKNVTSIGSKAFKGCKKLTTVTGGSKLKVIGASAFAGCVKLKAFTIGKKVTKIGAKAFYGDKALKKVTFKPKKVPTIGKSAFKGIAKKATFVVPKSAKKKYLKKLVKKVGVTSKMTIK